MSLCKIASASAAAVLGLCGALNAPAAAAANTITCSTAHSPAPIATETTNGSIVDKSCAGIKLPHQSSVTYTTNFDQHGNQHPTTYCLINTSDKDYFVPANSALEWTSFVNVAQETSSTMKVQIKAAACP